MAPSTMHPEPLFSDVVRTWIKHVVRPMFRVPGELEPIEKSIRNYIINLQRENHDDDEIYLKLAELHPLLGDPLAFYEEFVLSDDESIAAAEMAQKKAAKKADKAAERAAAEFSNKRKCIELEREVRDKETKSSALTTAEDKTVSHEESQIRVGCYVDVDPDLSVGKCSHGGSGFVSAVLGEGADRTFTVKYDRSSVEGGKTESLIPYNRIHERPSPFETSKQSRERKLPDNYGKENATTQPDKQPTPTEIHAILSMGYASNRAKGWRAKDLGVSGEGRQKSEHFKSLLREDAKELKGYLSANPNPPNAHMIRGRKGSFKKRRSNYSPVSYRYLASAWGVGKNFPKKVLNEKPQPSEPMPTTNPTQLSVIDSMEAAKTKYTAKNLFLYHRVRERMAEQEVFAYNYGRQEQQHIFREEGKAEWALLGDSDRAYWESQARTKIARQPYIRDNIIEAMRANPSKSFQSISEDIGHWCSASTIHKWFYSHGYCMYVQRALPLLTEAQKKKHIDFSKHLLNFWGLPRQKFLLVHYDEKWFLGWVSRATAKMCELLGLDKSQTHIYHRNHPEKVMTIAVTAFAFDKNPENGGHGIKIGLYRAQGARIAQKQVRASSRDADGNIRYDGEVLREKGDAYLVDCNVTGSDEGTSDAPKFALKTLFRDHIFPKVMEMVGPGGKYEGYLPIFQGDNAGPHIDKDYLNYVKDFCAKKGWHWEPQAPQMPHLNNLDLAVFPMMSKRHSNLLKQYSNKMAPKEEIWETAQSVWESMGSAPIARGFILAFRIAQKVIDNNGDNTFLQKTEFHSNIRNDFYDTEFGVAKKI